MKTVLYASGRGNRNTGKSIAMRETMRVALVAGAKVLLCREGDAIYVRVEAGRVIYETPDPAPLGFRPMSPEEWMMKWGAEPVDGKEGA